MFKQCPLWVIAYATSSRDSISVEDLRPSNDGHSFSMTADCKGSYCQMWKEDIKDCGLKQPNIVSDLIKIKDDVSPVPPEPVTNTSDSNYNLKDILQRVFEKEPPPDTKPDFHPVDCPAQFPSEPE